jgi:glycosyltransferase involved in cell wall biosynthesis
MHEVNNSCFVSVIVPVYNAASFIEETIDSVIVQTFKEWELIVVNDGSTDSTRQILNKYESNNQLRFVHKENTGVSDSRNTGARMARGKYICFLDADDILLPTCLERRVEAARDGAALIHNDIEWMDAAGVRLGIVKSGLSGNVLDNLLLWERTVIPGPSSMMVSEAVFSEAGGFDINLSTAADQDFFINVAAKHQVTRIAEVLTLYRVHAKGMHLNISLMQRDHIRVFQKAKSNKHFRSFWFMRRCFSNLYFVLSGSWWGHGNNKWMGLYFSMKALIVYPPNITKYINRFLNGNKQ